MRIAILADTHGFLDPRICDLISDCDVAVHAGDIGGAEVLLALKPRQEVVAIRGNNDVPEKWPEAEHHFLETLPREAALDLPGGQLVVVHGDDGGGVDDRHRRYRRRYTDARAVVYGHSHRLVTDLDLAPWILNPGAAGRTRTNGGPSFLILDCDESGWRLETLRLEPKKYPSLRRGGRRNGANGEDESAE